MFQILYLLLQSSGSNTFELFANRHRLFINLTSVSRKRNPD